MRFTKSELKNIYKQSIDYDTESEEEFEQWLEDQVYMGFMYIDENGEYYSARDIDERYFLDF